MENFISEKFEEYMGLYYYAAIKLVTHFGQHDELSEEEEAADSHRQNLVDFMSFFKCCLDELEMHEKVHHDILSVDIKAESKINEKINEC